MIRCKSSPLQVLRRACWRTAFWAPVFYLAGQSFFGRIEALGSQVLANVLQRFQRACRRLHCRSVLSKLSTAQHLQFDPPIIDAKAPEVSLSEVADGERAELQQVLCAPGSEQHDSIP